MHFGANDLIVSPGRAATRFSSGIDFRSSRPEQRTPGPDLPRFPLVRRTDRRCGWQSTSPERGGPSPARPVFGEISIRSADAAP